MNRIRFKTNAEDYRPIIFNPLFPWWCTGYDASGASIIVCYLPPEEDLLKYWDDAFDIDTEEDCEITFTLRFPRPDYYPQMEEEEST